MCILKLMQPTMMPFGNQTSLGNRAFCTAMIRWVMLKVKGEGQWQEEMGCAGCKRLFRSRHRTRSKWHLAFQGASPWEGRAGPDVLVVHTWRYSTNSLATTYIKIKKWNWCFQAHQVSCVWVCCSCAWEGKGWLCYVMLCYVINQKLFIQDEYINFLSPLTNIARSLSS